MGNKFLLEFVISSCLTREGLQKNLKSILYVLYKTEEIADESQNNHSYLKLNLDRCFISRNLRLKLQSIQQGAAFILVKACHFEKRNI